jgi:putative transposase
LEEAIGTQDGDFGTNPLGVRNGKPRFASGVAACENAAGHFKKNVGHPLNTERQRFERVKDLSPEFSIIDLCRTLQVSRSGYYRWKTGAVGPRGTANLDLVARIDSLFEEHERNYGSPRITVELRKQGIQCNHKRIERLMRAEGMRALQKKRFRVVTTDSNHDYPIAPNSLPDKEITGPDQGWCTDITYVETEEGWLYVAGVLDLHSRKIVGWAMEDHLETSLPLAALNMAFTQRRPRAGLLHHSDRGVQYASHDYRQALQSFGMEASMSRKGNCYDNATIESFWGTLKNELVYRRKYRTREEARRSIFIWIETYYNRVRIHSSLGYKSPVDFENQLN